LAFWWQLTKSLEPFTQEFSTLGGQLLPPFEIIPRRRPLFGRHGQPSLRPALQALLPFGR